jgi:hypothetical protein
MVHVDEANDLLNNFEEGFDMGEEIEIELV